MKVFCLKSLILITARRTFETACIPYNISSVQAHGRALCQCSYACYTLKHITTVSFYLWGSITPRMSYPYSTPYKKEPSPLQLHPHLAHVLCHLPKIPVADTLNSNETAWQSDEYTLHYKCASVHWLNPHQLGGGGWWKVLRAACICLILSS